MGELNRYNQILAKYQLEILNNYANSKKSSVSKAETRFKQILQTNKEKLGIDQIEDEDSRVLESGKMNWLLLPTAKVRIMVERQENLKEFTTKSLLVPYSIDILAGDNAFEVNGPFHYVRDSKTKTYSMNGHTKLKREFIEGVGLKYVEIPFWKLDEILLIHNDLQIAEIKNVMALQPGAKVQ